MKLTPTTHKFIVYWGKMGTQWGINRTVAQIHALLYLSPEALNAEEIIDILQVARSNVSTSLKELTNWGIVKVVPKMGDRREYYECLKDVCEMFRIIVEERKKREIDPTLSLIKECLAELDSSNKEEQYTRKRLKAFKEFFESTTQWYDRVKMMPMDKLMGLVKLEQKINTILKKK